MVFMKNLGGVKGCSGEWSICGGNSQSYADASVSVLSIIYVNETHMGTHMGKNIE